MSGGTAWCRALLGLALLGGAAAGASEEGTVDSEAQAVRELKAVPHEDGEGHGIELTLDLVSRYLWRGYDLSHRDPAALIYLNYAPPALAGAWINGGAVYGLSDQTDLGDPDATVDEVDVAVGFDRDFRDGRLTVGLVASYYGYRSHWTREVAYEDDDDFEVGASLTWNAHPHWAPFLRYFRGLDDEIEGDYVEAGFAAPLEWGEGWSCEPQLVAGWSSQYGVEEKFTNLVVNLPLAYSRGSWSFSASANWTHVADPEEFNPQELTGEKPRSEVLWFGLHAAYGF